MNLCFILCVIFGVIFSFHASVEEKLENLPSVEFLYDKINVLEGQLKRLEEKDEQIKKMIADKDDEMKKIIDEKDDEMKEMIDKKDGKINSLEGQLRTFLPRLEEKDDQVNLLENQVKHLSSKLENFQGQSTIEPAFIVIATKTANYIQKDVIAFDEKVIDHSNSFNIEEGIFKVPSSGSYLFFFDSFATNTGCSEVGVYVNGNEIYYFSETNGDSDHSYHQHIFMFSATLEEGDELWL